MDKNSRDDRRELQNLSLLKMMLLGITLYVPLSTVKVAIFKLLGAKIGHHVYIGPGATIISNDYSKVFLGDNVFISPQALVKVNKIRVRENSHIGYQCLLVGDTLEIGANCNVNNRAFIESTYAPVIIEDEVTISASVIISSHDGAYKQTHGLNMKAAPVILKYRSFIGNNAIILPGIIIGARAIVGAGALVTHDVKENHVVGGVPARVIKTVDQN
jgi:acetyltransferase-like isoleucine patch superfamily enzyme